MNDQYVYVLTFGHASYEDNVYVVGVYSSYEKATLHTQNRPYIEQAKYGEHYYDIQRLKIDAGEC